MEQQKTKYINPMTDFGFKKLFGDKEVMIAFLTAQGLHAGGARLHEEESGRV